MVRAEEIQVILEKHIPPAGCPELDDETMGHLWDGIQAAGEEIAGLFNASGDESDEALE